MWLPSFQPRKSLTLQFVAQPTRPPPRSRVYVPVSKLTTSTSGVCLTSRGAKNCLAPSSEVRFLAFLQAAALRLVEDQDKVASKLRRARARNSACDASSGHQDHANNDSHDDVRECRADGALDNFCGVINLARGLRSDESKIFGTS